MRYRLWTGYLKPYVQFYSSSSRCVCSNWSTDKLYRQTQHFNAIQQCDACFGSSEPWIYLSLKNKTGIYYFNK